jgi:hypothetical protein
MREQFDEIDSELTVLCPEVDTDDEEHDDSLDEKTPKAALLDCCSMMLLLTCCCCCLLRIDVTEGYGVNVNGGDAM